MIDLQKMADLVEGQLMDRYFEICDDRKEAVDPSDLVTSDWVIDLLAESYEIMLKVEDVMHARNIEWIEARQFV